MGLLLARRRAWDEWDENWNEVEDAAAAPPKRSHRLAGTMTFAVLFFAGAALSAGAGDQMHGLLGDDGGQTAVVASASASDPDALATTGETTTEQTTTDEAPAEQPPSSDAAPPAEPATDSESAEEDGPSGRDETAPRTGAGPEAAPSAADGGSSLKTVSGARTSRGAAARPFRQQATKRVHRAHRATAHRPAAKPQAPELEGPAAASTVWLNRALPDPTPPAARLASAFASELLATSKRQHLDWAFVLGVLRARGALGSTPSSLRALRTLESRLGALGGRANKWGAAVAYFGQTSAADRAVALGHFYRAIGLDAVVHGLESQRYALARRVVADRRVSVYAGGEGDLSSGRVNVRVAALIEYLAETFGQVTVSCLITGHRLYARPGVVSAHIYGHAVDISALGGTSILGHQAPGSVTERAVRAILLLPQGMLPRQVISLLGLGGPSFPLENHANHIHVGY